MNDRTKPITSVALIIAGIAAFAAAYIWFPTPSPQQWALFAVGSILTATGSAMVLFRCFLFDQHGDGVSSAWLPADSMLLPGCGAVLLGILLSMAGTSLLVIAVVYAWQDRWGLTIPLAIMAGVCFGTAYTTLRHV